MRVGRIAVIVEIAARVPCFNLRFEGLVYDAGEAVDLSM